jgi:uncharacterized membrane protein YfcA
MTFAVSGVEVSPLIPPLVALSISFFTSMGGVSGAFLLLPFQVSVLGFTSPGVSPTNMIFNIVAIPSGIYRYMREGRMAWVLAGAIIAGTAPGVLFGVILRVRYLPDPQRFRVFVGCILLLLGGRILYQLIRRASRSGDDSRALRAHEGGGGQANGAFAMRTIRLSWRRIAYEFQDQTYSFSLPGVVGLSLVLGVFAGAYGIGGGAILAPILVALYGLPVHTVAGATLLGTFFSSIAGVIFYTVVAPHVAPPGVAAAPDWLLGVLFGLGGLVGMYLGARCQKFVPATAIKLLLTGILLFVGIRYVSSIFV